MPSGDAMVAWTTAVFTGGSYAYPIGSMVRPVGSNWSAAVQLTSNDEHGSELRAAASSEGECVLTWVDANSGTLKASVWGLKEGWYDFATIAFGSDTALALGGNTALAIWIGGEFQAHVSTMTMD